MGAITAVTGIRPIVTHTGMDTDMVTMTLTTEATMVIILTITTGLDESIMVHAEDTLRPGQQVEQILSMQET